MHTPFVQVRPAAHWLVSVHVGKHEVSCESSYTAHVSPGGHWPTGGAASSPASTSWENRHAGEHTLFSQASHGAGVPRTEHCTS